MADLDALHTLMDGWQTISEQEGVQTASKPYPAFWCLASIIGIKTDRTRRTRFQSSTAIVSFDNLAMSIAFSQDKNMSSHSKTINQHWLIYQDFRPRPDTTDHRNWIMIILRALDFLVSNPIQDGRHENLLVFKLTLCS